MDFCSVSLILGAIPVVLMVLYYFHCRRGRCTSTVNMTGKIVIITGANTGVGKETAVGMANRGATVIIACRNLKKGEQALAEIKERSGNSDIHMRELDLSSLASVKAFAASFLKDFKQLHILINNAGVMHTPEDMKTKEGFEMQFGVNHLGHFALTNLLLERMVESGPARIVTVSSVFHKCYEYMDMDDLNWEKKPFDTYKAYGQSKLCNVLFIKELHHRLADKKVSVFAVHPGWVNSELARHPGASQLSYKLFAFIIKSPWEGAQTSLHCALQEGLETRSGQYFRNCVEASSSPKSHDLGLARQLWEKSEELTGVKYPF